jgi:hypothetical protein
MTLELVEHFAKKGGLIGGRYHGRLSASQRIAPTLEPYPLPLGARHLHRPITPIPNESDGNGARKQDLLVAEVVGIKRVTQDGEAPLDKPSSQLGHHGVVGRPADGGRVRMVRHQGPLR